VSRASHGAACDARATTLRQVRRLIVALLGVFGPANEQRLLGAMRTLLDAADHYVRANFPGAARRCVVRAMLIGAQLREPATRLIGLSMQRRAATDDAPRRV
jgi:hypothetical protein